MANTSEIDEATMAEPTPEEVELSKEELAKRRKEITDYYRENIKHLKVQLEYEELLKNIEQTRAERVQAQMFLAQATMGNQEGNNQEAAEAFEKEMKEQNTKRTLKRTEA